MKKKLLCLLCITLVLITGCSSQKNENETNIETNLNEEKVSKDTDIETNTTGEYSDYVGTYKNNLGNIIEIIIENNKYYLEVNGKTKEIDFENNTTSTNITVIYDIEDLISSGSNAYIYPKNVSFSLTDSYEDYDSKETDSTKYRIFIAGDLTDDEKLYYKE